jgi:predicted DNA-binding transcriptional regulator AlpA
MDELLTADELATHLKMSKWQVYELAKERTRSGDVNENPLPALRFGTSVRFRKSEVEMWLASLTGKKPLENHGPSGNRW